MVYFILFCDQVADSYETHQKVQKSNQSAGNWMNCRPVKRRRINLSQNESNGAEKLSKNYQTDGAKKTNQK